MRFLPRFELSATQLVATALAAITATVAASYLGVAGTVIGAALASVVSAIGTAVYSHSLRKTHARVREVVPARTARHSDPSPTPAPSPSRATRSGDIGSGDVVTRGRWHGVAIGSLALFVTVLAVVTGVEAVTGRPLSDLVRGDTGNGTTVFGTSTKNAADDQPAPAPTVTQTVTPSVVVVTPTVTKTAPAVTETATPTATSTPSPTAVSTGSSSTPAPSASPTG